jgi:hypothetical protein
MWTIITDTAGHLWLTNPSDQWVAGFISHEITPEIQRMLDTLNADTASLACYEQAESP